MEFDLSFLAVASGMVFVAAMAQSMSGFGFALVLAPLFSLVWDPHQVVIVSTILNGTLSLSITFKNRHHVSVNRVGLLLVGSLAGIPLGLVVLASLDPNPLRVLIGLSVFILGGLVYLGLTPPLKRERLWLLISGVLSGLLHSSTSMGGPPVVLCLMSQGHEKELMRGTLLGFFGPLSVLTVAGFWLGGLVRIEALLVSVAMVPALSVGIWLGAEAFKRAPGQLYRAIVALLIAVAGILSVLAGLRS